MLAMNLLEKIYNNLNHEKIWGSDGLTPLNNFKSNSGGYTACCPNPAHPKKKTIFPHERRHPCRQMPVLQISSHMV